MLLPAMSACRMAVGAVQNKLVTVRPAILAVVDAVDGLPSIVRVLNEAIEDLERAQTLDLVPAA
jgi:hypothetical protein